MKQNKRRSLIGIEDPQSNLTEFYDPFSSETIEQIKKQGRKKRTTDYKCAVTLFGDEDSETVDEQDSDIYSREQQQVELNVMKPLNFNKSSIPSKGTAKNLNRGQDYEVENKPKSSILSKIIQNTKNPKKQNSRLPNYVVNEDDENYGFNTNYKVAYPQTPGFKSLLQSPFGKFNYLFKDIISVLSKNNQNTQPDTRITNYQTVEINQNPLNFYNTNKLIFEAAKYFIGICLKLKEMNCLPECLYFCNLACYAEPFNDKPWKKYVSLLQEQGKLNKACILAKTGFLFTQSEDLIKSFLLNGEKCGYPLYKLQGIICSVSNPELFEKTLLPESAKIQVKYGKSWKGIKVLYQICKLNDFKLSVCLTTIFLARYLENIGYQDKAMTILKQSFSKSMSKLEIYLLYIQMSMRKNKFLIESDLQEVLKYIDCISSQNRYRLLLEIAQILYKNNDQRYYTFFINAYKAAVEYCAPGTGCNKALKQIYFTLSKLKGISPQIRNIMGDQSVFELNRHKFISGQPLIQYEFSDWKYYLHYGVVKKQDLLIASSRKWPQTGRVIAEWIHCLRMTKKPLHMLKIWRQKIDQVPKSGQLWCQGGRIYAELGQYANASKCFRYAMHFTPQYGDSFIEQLRLLLKDSRFLQIHKLKKAFLVCEPFYGHVLSYLKQSNWQQQNSTLTLNQVWQHAIYEISQHLYSGSNSQSTDKQNKNTNIQQKQTKRQKLFTALPSYNSAFANPQTKQIRQKLFTSYQQMQNKN